MQIMMSVDVTLYILIHIYMYVCTTVSEEYAASIFKVEYTLLL